MDVVATAKATPIMFVGRTLEETEEVDTICPKMELPMFRKFVEALLVPTGS